MKRKRPHCTKNEEVPKGATELEIPIARAKVKEMSGEELLQAEVYLGMVKNKRLVEKVTKLSVLFVESTSEYKTSRY